MPQIVYEHTSDGYGVFLNNSETGLKLAVISTKHLKPRMDAEGKPITVDGRVVEGFIDQGVENWSIHFTSPSMSIKLIKAIMESLPEKA